MERPTSRLGSLTAILLAVTFGAVVYKQYIRDGGIGDSSPERPEYTHCQTATACAKLIAMRANTNPEKHIGVTATASEETLTYEYALNYSAGDFNGTFEDGSTLTEFENQLRSEACLSLYHRDFVNMGGSVVHSYRYSDGEAQLRVAISTCPQ